MLKIYDQNKNPAGYISKYKDACVESDLETGDKSLSFTYCARKSKNIQNEYYIETKDDRYVVKETGISSDGFPEYQCKLDLEDLESYMHSSFASENSSLLDAARLAVAGTGWKVKSEIAADKIRKVAALKATPYTILGKIRDAWMCEMSFDTKNKAVCFSEKIGNDKGVYFVSGLNLNKIKYTEDTYDFYTRIVPIGKDGLKITDINSGKEYVENYQYSSKVRTLIWEDTNYEDAAAMKEDAIAKLADLSKPKKSYSVEVFDLAKQNQKYSLLEYALGDTILLLDEKTGTREKQRIVKMKEYLQTPEKNTCELSNTVLSWEEYQSKLEAARSAFENITNADGTVKGVLVRGVEANGVVGIETVVNNSPSVKDMQSQIITVKGDVSSLGSSVNDLTGEVSLVKARIGTVEATYIKANEADIKYATLEKADILQAKVESIDGDYANFKSTVMDELSAHTAKIDNLNGDYAEFKEATITDLSAVNARIDTVNANNITAENLEAKVAELGYLSAEKAEIIYLKTDELESKVGTFGYLRADEAKLKYADIGLANVNNAWIENGIIKDGSIGSGAIHDGAITNAKIADATIEAAKIKSINADNIIAGTIKTDRLIITGKDGEESIVEVINRANGVSEAEINNTKIQAASIDVADLSAFQAQIAGFNMSNYAIYSGKTSIKDPTSGIYISTVGIGMGDGALTGKNESPLQAYADGSFKLIGKNSIFDFNTVSGTLDMEVSSLKIASKSVATSDDIDDVLSEKTTVIEIESSNGAPLKDGATTTALSVIIYNGQNRITTSDELYKVMSSDVHLKWYYKTNDESNYIDIPANDSRISNDGFKLVPTADDIANRVSFKCRLVSIGSGYITPDRETAIDRAASRLQDYVDETILPSVKNDITSEINKDVYVSQIEQNKDNIAKLQDEISNGPVEQDLGLAWLGWSNDIGRGNGIENDAIMFSKHDIVGMQRLNLYRLADSKPQFTENTLKILKRARELNPKLRTFEYIQSESGRTDFTYNGDHAHLNNDGSWEGSTADLSGCTRIYTYQQICDWLNYFKESGTDGVFFDDWGYDFAREDICYQMGLSVDDYTDKNAALNQKWIMLIEACHERGLFLITNGGMPFSVGDWYTYLDENDIICLESCLISSTNYKDDFTWENGQKNIYDYYVNWYSNRKCKAKLWSMNYFQSDADGAYREQVLTYLCAITLACGGHYVSMGTFRCIEKPEFVQLFAEGNTKTIKKIDDNTYQLKVNNHILEVRKWSNLSGKVSEETVAKNYYVLDGRKFCNGFLTAPVVDGELAGEIEVISKKLNSMGDDSRKNAISYWRMAIDDWSSALSFLDYTNLIQLDSEAHSIDNGTIQTVTNSDGSLDIVCTYKELSQGGIYLNVIRPSNYEDFGQTGSGLEFGFSDVIFDMTDDSWTLPNGTVYEAAWLWATPSFYIYVDSTPLDESSVTDYKIDGIGSGLGVATGHYKKSQQKTFTSYNIRVWFHAPEGKYFNGTVTIKDVYLIDLGEHEDEITKKWYTNIFPGTFNTTSAMTARRTLTEKYGQKVYDFTVSHTDAWGWTKYKYTGDELLALRGHTIELGCTSLIFSDGETGIGSAANGWTTYAFGIGANTDTPNTVRLYADTVSKSEVWNNERLCCLRYTIPDDATSLVIGFQSFGFSTDVTVTIQDVYLYDLGEEVAIRGKTSTNASLQLCRVTESQESLTPSNIRNALYITEKGRMYCYDLSGVKTDIAGSIYIGAAEAGYTGSPEEFGSVLFKLIQNGGTGSAGDLDIAATIKEKLRLESDDSYIYLKYDSEEISKIPFKGATSAPDPEPDPTVTVHIGKGASWTMSGTDPKLGANAARAYSYAIDAEPSTGIVDSVHKHGIVLENGQTYTIKLDSSVAPGCYYGLNVYTVSGRVLDSGWKAAGTDYSYTPSSDGLYLYVNFKSGSAGSATITDEILETMMNGFSITKGAVL